MHITDLTFKRKPIIYFLLCCIVIGGIYAFERISKLEDPEIVIMQARVITIYPGANAHEVELQVTDVLEKELRTLSDIHIIMSKSEANVSMITVELKMTVPQHEIQQRWEFMRRKVQGAIPKLPEGAQTPIVMDDIGDVYGMFYAITAQGYSYEEMHEFAGFTKRQILNVPGVSRVHLFGEQEPVVDIVLTTETMGQLGVFPAQIMAAITGNNSMVYPGVLETGDHLIRVDISDRISSIEDFRELVIPGISGASFRLGDIATVEKSYARPLRNTMYVNNEKAMAIAISMESGENIITLGKRVEQHMAEIQAQLPAGVHCEKVFFQPDKVSEAIHGFMWNLVASVLIVVLVLMATMGLRSGIIIGIGLVLTVLATFPILLATNGTLQRISLGAFIVAMGMLVDNAIVVMDGILVDMHKGRDPFSALTRTAKRTAIPLLGATLIAVTAFLPVFLSKDTAGTYARDLFVVLCISLLISWLLALTQVPLFAASFMKFKKLKPRSSHFTAKINQVVGNTLSFLVNHKIATIAVATLLMAITAVNIRLVKNAFFPDMNYDQVYIEYVLPPGTSPERVQADLHDITERLLAFDEISMVVSSQGMTPARYCLVRAIGEASDSYGELIVNFDNYRTMLRMKPILDEFLHANYPDADIRIRKYNLSIKATHTVEVEFKGPDPAVLRQLSAQALDIMHKNQYTDKYTIGDDWNPPGLTWHVQYDNYLGSLAGINRADVSNAMLAATSGIPLGRYYEGQTAYTIMLKMRNSDGEVEYDLRDIPVWPLLPDPGKLAESDLGELIYGTKSLSDIMGQIVQPTPLSAVTSGLGAAWNETLIRRSNGQRAIQAQCDPIEGISPARVRKAMLRDIEAIDLPEAYSYEWVGEYELQNIALKNIFSYLPVAIMLIVLILVVLFNDVKKPAIVLLCIPLTAIGIVPGLIITGSPFTFMAIVGAIGLSGMLIKNAIVLIDEIEHQISEGIPRYAALVNATLLRTRPVIMASVTTMLGMLPLLRDPMYSAMAVTIISGLLFGTIITLIFVPILYAAFFKITKKKWS